MLTIPVFGSDGQKIGEESIDPADFGGKVNRQLLHDVVVMHLANRRVGTVNTRGRADVAGSGKKLFRQKGTGNARAGAKRTNKRKGGGVAFARRNRDYRYALPKRAVRQATRMAILSKFQDGQAVIVEDLGLGGADAKPKTKVVVTMLRALGRPDDGRAAAAAKTRAPKATNTKAAAREKSMAASTVLIGIPENDPVAHRSARNIEGVMIAPVAEFNTYDVLKQRYLLLTRAAFVALCERAKAAAVPKVADA
jgi:large subunit ribosomal protein L4